MIKLKDFKVNDYFVNCLINENKITAIYSVSSPLLKEVMLKIAGINSSQGIFYHDRDIYDNEKYFENRLYLDCNKKYLNTLNAQVISLLVKKEYRKVLNLEKFNKLINEFYIRSMATLKSTYAFSIEANTLVNDILSLSMYTSRILLNPLENVEEQHLDKIKEKFKQEQNTIMGASNLLKYKDLVDHLIILGSNNAFYFDLKDDVSLYVITSIIDIDFFIEEMNIKENIVYINNVSSFIIVDKQFSKEDARKIEKSSGVIKKISVYEIGEYIC